MGNDFYDNTFLIMSLKKGSTEAYSFLIDTYYSKLFIYALNLSNNRNLSEDIVQNVYLVIWEKRKKLDPQLSIKSLLYKAVYNNFITQYKKKKAIGDLEKKYMETVSLLTEENDNSFFNKKLKILKKEIGKLPPKCQRVFLLSKQEGLTNNEISEYMDISINTVENHISKAFSILREQTKSISKSILFLFFKKKQFN